MKKKWLTVLSLVLLVVLCVSYANGNFALAERLCNGAACSGTGNQNPSGSVADCGSAEELSWAYSTCYGATWRYEAWTYGDSPHTIYGNGKSYSETATIDGEAIQICKKAGGYYRYAMVNRFTGEQTGVLKLSGHGGSFESQMLGGKMPYRDSKMTNGGKDWNEVVNAYADAEAKYGDFGPGLVSGSGLTWFCATEGGDPGDDIHHCEGSCECEGISVPNGYNASVANGSSSMEGWSSVRTQVKNLNSGDFTNNDLWLKPTDSVLWRHCYFPGMQVVSDKKVTTSHSEHSETVPLTNADEPTPDPTDFSLSNSTLGNLNGWSSAYKITDKNGNSSSISYDFGDYNVKRVDHPYNVDPSWVGHTYTETSDLSLNTWYHAKANAGVEHKWDCTWTRKITAANPENEPSCAVYGCYLQNGLGFSNIPDKNVCESSGGTWKVMSYKDPCMIESTTNYTCSHGKKLYYEKTSPDTSMYSGDKSSESATVYVPYNFNMSGSVKIKTGSGNVVYAGETAKLEDAEVHLSNKENLETKGVYATKAPIVKAKYITYVSDINDTGKTNPSNGTIRTGDVMERKDQNGNWLALEPEGASATWAVPVTSVNVDDTTAGRWFCVALLVYPSSSGIDRQMDAEGNRTWGMSQIDCKQIAKRPTVQVWGGSLFSNGNITTSRAEKNNLNGFADRSYKISGVSGANVFGSWDELSVMTIGLNQKFGSGAGTADRQLGGWTGVGRYEKKEVDAGFCKYESPLTFANYAKKGKQICGVTKNATGQFSKAGIIVEKESYVTSITNGKKPSGGSVGNAPFQLGVGGTYSVVTSATGKQFLYTIGNGDIHITTSEIALGQTYIVQSTGGSVFIEGNITYKDGAVNADEIPKLIVYAKNDIKINCSVNRVDAALIAENTVDTCRDSNNINDAKRSNQLVINGTVIANKINLKRTYGAGAGIYSSIPAEIINYDSSLVMWARSRADTTQTGTLNETYTHELAPRY